MADLGQAARWASLPLTARWAGLLLTARWASGRAPAWAGLVPLAPGPLAPALGRVCALCSGLPRIIRLGRTGADWAAMQLGRFVDAGLFKL